jgi:hypothetical protein
MQPVRVDGAGSYLNGQELLEHRGTERLRLGELRRAQISSGEVSCLTEPRQIALVAFRGMDLTARLSFFRSFPRNRLNENEKKRRVRNPKRRSRSRRDGNAKRAPLGIFHWSRAGRECFRSGSRNGA